MGMPSQTSYSSPNPLNFNYPKMVNVRGTQYGSYPSFKETSTDDSLKNNSKEKDNISNNLAKELEKQIQELQKLTKEAKELAKQVKFSI